MHVIECLQSSVGAHGDGVGAQTICPGGDQRSLHHVPSARVVVGGTGDDQPAVHARIKITILDVIVAGEVSVNLNRSPGTPGAVHIKNCVGHDLYLPLDVNDARIAVVKLAT